MSCPANALLQFLWRNLKLWHCRKLRTVDFLFKKKKEIWKGKLYYLILVCHLIRPNDLLAGEDVQDKAWLKPDCRRTSLVLTAGVSIVFSGPGLARTGRAGWRHIVKTGDWSGRRNTACVMFLFSPSQHPNPQPSLPPSPYQYQNREMSLKNTRRRSTSGR